MIKMLKFLSGPLVGALIYILLKNNIDYKMAVTAAVGGWMAIWWITEGINIYFTALIPITFFPFLGVISMKELAPSYMPEVIFFFIGGFLLAFALERWNLHRKLALKLLIAIGGSPAKLLFGFMFISYFLSMWILNTAVVMMLLPAALAVIEQVREQVKEVDFDTPVLLGIAYSASIGGTGTLIGTAPNLYFSDFFNQTFITYEPITFASWFMVGAPASFTFFLVAYMVLKRWYLKGTEHIVIDVAYCQEEYQKMGKLTRDQWIIGAVFGTTVLLWFTAKDLSIGFIEFKGWTNFLPYPTYIKESSIAMLAAFVLCITPSQEGEKLLSWESAKKIPLGVIFLFGGGFALSKVVTTSGLGVWMGEQMGFLQNYPALLVVMGLTVFMTFFTELTSNTASTVLMLPILAVLTQNIDMPPLLVMMPVVLSASYAFMLPVATPPNTIVYGTEKISSGKMARIGFSLNCIGVVVSSVFVLVYAKWIYGL